MDVSCKISDRTLSWTGIILDIYKFEFREDQAEIQIQDSLMYLKSWDFKGLRLNKTIWRINDNISQIIDPWMRTRKKNGNEKKSDVMEAKWYILFPQKVGYIQ